jgi:hypothetical protein
MNHYFYFDYYKCTVTSTVNKNTSYMFRKYILTPITVCILIIGGCCHEKKSQHFEGDSQMVIGPRIIIYKTKADYFLNIPVGMSADKKTINSYPAIQDIYTNGKLAFPTKLKDGFLLDNRGISPEVAFIRLTYEQYAALPATPALSELQDMIIDRDPITVMYDCGNRNSFQNIIEDINKLIAKNDFSKFKKIK